MLKPSFETPSLYFSLRPKLRSCNRISAFLAERMRETYSVVERSSHQELEGEVVGPLGVFASVLELGVVPVDLEILHVSLSQRA
jgi:hypothetical protein